MKFIQNSAVSACLLDSRMILLMLFNNNDNNRCLHYTHRLSSFAAHYSVLIIKLLVCC